MDAPHIWVPKLDIAEAHIVVPGGGAAGFFIMETVNSAGRVTQRREWKQLITNQAMDALFFFVNDGTGSLFNSSCHVGTGSPTFTNSSTGLAAPLATVTTTVFAFANTTDTVGTDNYKERHTKTWEFGLGAIVGNLTEVGIFGDSTNNSGAFLDLIRDSGGTPTTFPVTSSDILRVTHILDRYPFLSSTSGSFTIGGAAGSGSHNYEASMQNLTQSTGGGPTSAGTFGIGNNIVQSWGLNSYRDVSALGANTAGLTGAVALGFDSSSSGGANGTASNDGTTWKRTKTFTYGLTTANHLNGISGFTYGGQTSRCMKVRVDPPIPKFAGSIQRILSVVCDTGLTRV